MAAALPPVFSTKLKLLEPPQSLIDGNKFLKWSDSNVNSDKCGSANPVGVHLKVDEKCFILYWRDLNKPTSNKDSSSKSIRRSEKETNSWSNSATKSEFLDIALIRDVKTGKYAFVPKDKNLKDVLSSGKSNAPINDKTITILYGIDCINLQSVNFVSLADDAVEVAKEWTDFLFKCSINQRMQNLSPWEHLIKLRSCLIYGKAIIDEKTHDFRLPVQILVDTLISNGKQNIESERQHIHHMLQSVGLPCGKNDMIDEATLTIEKFFQLFLRLVSKEDIEQIFFSYAASKRKLYLNPEQFENFLNKEQRDPGLNELLYPFYTTEKAAEMIHKFETDESFRKKKQLSPQGLMRYLMDFENEIIDPIKYELFDDMEQPLSHYFINSSHNTYLTGHQITGKSDAEMYRQVLLSGCRCIELDCHEDDNLDEPIITHGRTLCTKILFSEAIHAIKESAFKTTPYPVLLSFENFCGKRMQEKMAKYLVDILGDLLLKDPLPDYPLKQGFQLPTPEDLKYKILVKFRKKRSEKMSNNSVGVSHVKNDSLNGLTDNNLVRLTSVTQNLTEPESTATPSKSNQSTNFSQQTSVNSYQSEQNKKDNPNKKLSLTDRNNSQQTNSDFSDSEREDYPGDRRKSDIFYHRDSIALGATPSSSGSYLKTYQHSNSTYSERESQPVTLEMATLVNYLQPTTFRSFEISQKKNKSFEISSFVETNAFNLHKEKPTEFVNYNKRQFSRIYPKGTRISSDNFIPQVQNSQDLLRSFGMSVANLGMQLNQGKFEYNNRCGYLLKPEIMRRTDVNKLFDPFAESPLDGIVATTLKIRIISGIFLNGTRNDSEKRLGQTVTVELYGIPADSFRGQKAHRVKASSSNTFNVIYSDSGYTFKKIIMPQLALINLTVLDEQSKMIGHRVLPVVGLRPGYRYVCLKNESNQPLNMCTLFVHIQLHDYVPEEYEEFANALVNPINYVLSLAKKEEMLRTLTDENENAANENLYEPADDLDENNENDENEANDDSEPNEPNTNASSSSNKETDINNNTNNISNNNTNNTNSNITNILIPIVNKPKKSLTPSIRTGSHANILNVNNNNSNNTNNNQNNLNINNNFLLSNNLQYFPCAAISMENRLSISADKFGQSLLSKTNLMSMLDLKRKSQSDLMTSNSAALSASMYNISRSCSLNCQEFECMDLKKLNMTNKSQLNDPNLFREIDVESLMLNKSYVQLSKSYAKKFERLEKETEKKVSELIQNLNMELDKISSESQKIKSKLEKGFLKQTKKKLIIKGLKTSKSTPNLDVNINLTSGDSDLSARIQLQNANADLNQLMINIRQKYVKQMLNTYEESYKTIKLLKFSSVPQLSAKLEKLIQETAESRMQQLKAISEKEISIVNKQTHQQIKLKKKKAAQTSHDKEEFQRLSREIEKESVALAVSENSKMEELLKAKQKLLRQVIDKSLNSVKDFRERKILDYENEFKQKIEEKRTKIEKSFLIADLPKASIAPPISSLSPTLNDQTSQINKNELKKSSLTILANATATNPVNNDQVKQKQITTITSTNTDHSTIKADGNFDDTVPPTTKTSNLIKKIMKAHICKYKHLTLFKNKNR